MTANEENYYQLSHKRVAPEAFHINSAVFDSSKGRIVSEYIIGNMVKYLGYESAFVLGRLLAVLGFSAAFAFLFLTVKARVVDILLVMSVFILFNQTLFAGEWLFVGFESKIFSYICVIFSISMFLRKQHYFSLFLLIAATYFHFLVGFFWTVFVFSTVLWVNRNLLEIIKFAVIYTFLTTPLLLLLLPEFTQPEQYYEGLSTAHIYANIRAPHHVAPFYDLDSFYADWLPGIIWMLLFLAAGVVLFKYFPEKKLANLSIISFAYTTIFLVLAFIDKDTLLLSKFYMFRQTSLGLLLFLISVSLLIKQHMQNEESKAYYVGFVFLCAFFIFTPFVMFHNNADLYRKKALLVTSELLLVVDQKTDPDDVILTDVYDKGSLYAVKVIRTLPRPTLVSWKFIPTNKSEIIKWYSLYKQKEEYFEKPCEATSINTPYFIVFDKERYDSFRPCSEILFEDEAIIFARQTIL
ncbi:MAG: hypothetical protein GC137_01900 [Alphaproteobacteria bacterium]|nr:hypothetical protein [Alphaproteobacteria bacterium]